MASIQEIAATGLWGLFTVITAETMRQVLLRRQAKRQEDATVTVAKLTDEQQYRAQLREDLAIAKTEIARLWEEKQQSIEGRGALLARIEELKEDIAELEQKLEDCEKRRKDETES